MKKLIKVMLIAYLPVSFSHATVKELSSTDTTLSLEVSERYVLGDNESIIDARNVNLEQIKVSAAAYAGTYVEQEVVVNDSQITNQQINMLTAGFVEVVSMNEKKGVDDFGSVYLTSVAKVNLSKKEIKGSINRLKEKGANADKLESLKEDYIKLRKQFIDLTNEIKTNKQDVKLTSERQEIIKHLGENRSEARQVFKEGVLLQEGKGAIKDKYARLHSFSVDFLQYIKANTNVSLGKPRFDKAVAGYSITIPVYWAIDSEELKNKSNEFFNAEIGKSDPSLLYIQRDKTNTMSYSTSVFNQLAQKDIKIRVVVKGQGFFKTDTLTIGQSSSYIGSNRYYAIKTSCQLDRCKMIGKYDKTNEAYIYGLNESNLNRITSINADIIF